ncbi:vitelline membrane outer layer protein 1 homolog isoform X2 [Pseudophryne corroboree]
MLVEKPQGQRNESIANGIGIVFGSPSSTDKFILSSSEAKGGESTATKRCSGDGYLVAFALKYYRIDKQRRAVSNIKFLCSTGEYLEGDGEKRGSFEGMSETCPDGIVAYKTFRHRGRSEDYKWAFWSDILFHCFQSHVKWG